MSKQILYISLTLFITVMGNTVWAQQTEKPANKNKLQWGFQVTESFDALSQSAGNDNIETSMKSVMLLGAFIQSENAELNINAGYLYIGAELSYNVYQNWALVVGGSTGSHGLEIERESYDYNYSYTDGDVNVTRYYLGVGYHNTFWQRLKLQANAKVGGVNTNKATAVGYIGSYEYYYNTNKKALKIDTYHLSPSFIYGANLYMELLPRVSKNRKKPLVPFLNLSVMGNGNSNISRKIIIEEWVPGNVVYEETSEQHGLKYDLLSLQVQFGVKWYLKY
jgi:hypothetical protein